MTRRGKFDINTNLRVKSVSTTDMGTAFSAVYSVFCWLKYPSPSNAPHGWRMHKPQPNLSMSVGPIPVQSMERLRNLTLIDLALRPTIKTRRGVRPSTALHAITRPTIIIGMVRLWH